MSLFFYIFSKKGGLLYIKHLVLLEYFCAFSYTYKHMKVGDHIKKLHSFLALFSVFIVFTFTPVNVSFAEESSIDKDLIEIGDFVDDTEDNSHLVEGVDYDIETETIYFDDIVDYDLRSNIVYTNNNENLQDSTNQNRVVGRALVMPGPLYKTTDNKFISETVGTKTLWKTSGQPGINIGLGFSKSTTATVSQTYGASYSNLSANLNFTIGKSYSVSSTGSYLVPKKHNGKAVSKAEVSGHPIYRKYSMKVSKRNDIYFRYDYKGVAYAYKPIGVDVKYKHYYK
ncbi:hypothetical protein [Peribacillus sp. SI8-4]|uniref:hypothetical protein n=1 Tax=Peribacillus sp. SI8-4 TaxID=3048009 RepID=UPI00255586D0|nr:hypothetical protein [Peribacillus sp. SI8-4]